MPDRLFETIANYTYDWESWMSPQGRPLWINPAVTRITGATVACCLAMADYPLPLILAEDRPVMARALAAARAGTSENDVEFRIARPDGTLRWCAMSWQPLYDAEGVWLGFRTSVRDITHRKQAEAAQAAARTAAEQADRAKSRILAAASHDLRQPLQAAELFVGALRRRGGDAETRGLVEQIGLCLASTQELLDALLDLSRLEAGMLRVKREPLALQDLFERLETEFAQPAAEKGLALRTVATSLFAESDALLLYRILQNFTANALRYTRQGRILIGARRHWTQSQGEAVRIEVHDSGIGIPADQIARIFQEFTQVENPERDRNKGLGLGLAIVERLAGLLELPIGVRSTPGRGSCFWVAVPLTEAAPQALPDGDRTAPPRLVGRHIAVLDNEPVVRQALALFLRGEGARVTAAGSAGELLRALESEPPPALLIADYRLPGGLTGAQAARDVRRRHGASLPVLLLTGDTEPSRLTEAQASGFRLLHKPLDVEALLAVLAETLGG